ncbi:MAG: protein translocase subunit SecF [Gemmatimonadota bacterium]|nr:protein translocase subunit SecF [Gemmatimonadota bacterium]
MIRIFSDAHFAFISMRKRAYMISAGLILVGLLGMVVRGGFNTGVEFTGGTMLQVRVDRAADVAEVRDVMNAGGFTGVQIQPLRGAGESAATPEFLIRVPTEDDLGLEGVREQVSQALSTGFGESGYEIRQSEAIGPRVGSELRTKAIMALGLSFLLTLIYLAFRFEWRFGFAAVIATLHDMTVAFGFIALLDIEISLATVAAILTIIGYSLNDTIVVFDRVRENLKKKRKESYEDTLDRSINETLPRTVLTSGTTLVALISLFVLGGAVIRPFALVLIVGILIGTYSSIFVASPALYEIQQRAKRKARAAAHATG